MTNDKSAQYSVIHVCDAGIFPAKILCCFGMPYDEIIEELKKQNCDDWVLGLRDDKILIDGGKNFALKREFESDHGTITLFYIIFTNPFDFTDYEMCKLAHEVLHICQFMLPDFLNMEREYECVAYTHTYLMQQCLKVLRDTNKN